MTTEAENSGIEPVESDSSDDGRRMKWYVVTTYSGYENKVKQALRERIRQHKMEDRFGEVLIPSESVTLHGKDGKSRVRAKTTFPGYVFVEMLMSEEVRVIVGAFANFSGTVQEVKPDKQKLKVMVSIFGRPTPVELDFNHVEKR
jgi:transcriptional antiterminator NusG